MDGRMERREEAGGGVGGQRLKLHHKSHPERKREVVPPSLPPSLPLTPHPPPTPLPPVPVAQPRRSLLFHGSIASLLFHTEWPMDGPGVFYITPSCTSNSQTQAHFYPGPSAFYLPLFTSSPSSSSSSASLQPLACCKSINLQLDMTAEAALHAWAQ